MTKAVFILLWSTTFVALTGPFSAKVNLGALGCNIGQVKPISSLGFVAITVFDTTVFVAISVKVLQINSDWRTPKRSWVVSFIHGHGLTQVSNVLLRSGQYYYLATVGFSVFTLIALLSPASAFSPTFRAGFTFVSLAVLNMMACRVFRLLRLGALPSDLSTLRLPTIEFAHDETSNIMYTEVSQRSEVDEEQLANGLV
ncbi:hypothetical protein QCA50_002518 [Cerrena zonata]|uniref:Vomeronasal type-1 receptor n=1 Tax=Cerrena zonata TaxID=2478898 RepID=A0AAW0GTK6_9APHY